MDRFTKLAITVWAGAAIALQVWLLHYSWRQLPTLTLLVVVGMAMLAYVDRRAVGVVLVTAYVFPVLVYYLRGLQSSMFVVLWLAALLGAMLPDLLRTRWHLPQSWRVLLVFSVLAVALSAVIVIVREIDGVPLLLTDTAAAFWRGGTPPSFTVRWVLHVSLTLVIGVLWFDWLCGAGDMDIERTVVTPLVISALAMSVASLYQMFVDPSLWNNTVFLKIGRATGTTYDANIAGVLGALWLGGTWLWAVRLRGWRLYAVPVALVVHAVALWGSGSRTSLVAALGTVAGIGASGLFQDNTFRRGRAVAAAGVVVLALGGAAAFGAANQQAINPVARLWDLLVTHPSPADFLGEMWNRNGYGTVATQLVVQSPIAGVGVGAFHGLVTEVGLQSGRWLPPDNAQNWLRHQVAELGFVGASGWLLWFAFFAAFVCIPRRGEPESIWTARGMLVAFGFISMFGMPGQDPMVAITFWTVACWYTRLAGPPPAPAPLRRWVWMPMAVALVVFGVASTEVARGWLRLPARAVRGHYALSYGYAPIIGAGPDAGYRAVSARAVTVVDPQGGWFVVTVRLTADDMPADPVDVRVWKDGVVVLKAQLTTTTPFSGAVPVEATAGPMVIETSTRQGGTPRWWPFGADAGVLMKWEFVNDIPGRFKGYRQATDGG